MYLGEYDLSLFKSTRNTRMIIKDSARFIRSDVPVFLQYDELQWLKNNNVRTVIDLREKDERVQKPCILENNIGFHYISIPVTVGNKIPRSPEEVVKSYISMVDPVMDIIVDTVMNADTNVLYFCNAGKDRTGVVTAIILCRLGYDKQYITDDYLVSGVNLRNDLLAFASDNPDIDINVITPIQEYMEKFLEWYRKSK